MFNGSINPGQLSIVRTIRNSTTQETLDGTIDSDGIADIDTAVFSGARAEYDITFNANGTVTVAHTGGLATDGTDHHPQCRAPGIRRPDHLPAGADVRSHGNVTVTTTTTVAQAYRDPFDTASHSNSNGTVNWTGTPWVGGQ